MRRALEFVRLITPTRVIYSLAVVNDHRSEIPHHERTTRRRFRDRVVYPASGEGSQAPPGFEARGRLSPLRGGVN